MDYALIGCGRIAVNHLNAAVGNGLHIVGICDTAPEHAQALLRKTGYEALGIPIYTDYRAMLDERKPTLSAIATESGKHAAIAIDCIQRGVATIIEKPIALSMADADAIVSLSEKTGVPVCACHQNRFNEAVRRLRTALDAGRFGKLSHGSICVRWNRGEAYYAQAPWRGTWEQDGGALMNQSIHGIDLLGWLLGYDVESVYGVTGRRLHEYLETEDVGQAVIRFRSGVTATIEGTVNAFGENLEETLTIFGETGLVRLGGMSANEIAVWRFQDECASDAVARRLTEKTANVYGNGHRLLYADMIDAVEQGRNPTVDARAGRNALELVLAIYKSQLIGAPVTLPLTGFSTRDMQNYFVGGAQ